MSQSGPDRIINCSSGGDIVFTLGAYPGTEIARFKLINGAPAFVTPKGTQLFLSQLATTPSDGTNMTFAFPTRIGSLIEAYIGGIAQLPADVSVDNDGSLVFGSNVEPPQEPVTASFVGASA